MTDLDALLADAPMAEPTVNVTRPRRCRKHTYALLAIEPGEPLDTFQLGPCTRCGAPYNPERSRRGRTSLRAGKDAERTIAKRYGGQRTGQFGGPDDVVVGDLFVIQSKAGGWFSERVWAELAKLPRAGGRIPTLVVSERPAPGVHARRYVVRTLDDDLALHGPTP